VHSLGIEGGTLVTSTGRSRSHVYVADSRIAAVSAARQPARECVDAGGLLVLPGMVDAHVHLMDPAEPDREDFPTGTAAAAAAGVTTIVEHTHAGPVRTATELEEKRAYLETRARVDFALAAHAWPDQLEEIEPLWRAGVAFLKVFTCTTHGVPGFDTASLLELLRRAAAVDAVCLVHCEDEAITGMAERRLRATGEEGPDVVPKWRSREGEHAAVAVVAALASATGARVVIAHASHSAIVALARRTRMEGANLAVETCPQYLLLREDEILEHGPLRKFTPPARAQSDADLVSMWEAVADGRVDYVASDHAPSTLAQKRAGSIWDAPFGLPGLDTTLSVLLDGAHAGRVPYERVAAVYAEAPARQYGLYPRKGTVEVGADADLVLLDPDAAWTVRDEDIRSKAGWSPFAGRTLRGRAVHTYLRGSRVAAEGNVLAEPGTGRFLSGPGAEV
jgi:allantoinase